MAKKGLPENYHLWPRRMQTCYFIDEWGIMDAETGMWTQKISEDAPEDVKKAFKEYLAAGNKLKKRGILAD